MKISNLKELFEQPPVEYKGVPFWSWNDTLEQDELDNQVKGFKEQGMGGFMMHVREGLETPYLSDEFMERVKQTVATAKQESFYAREAIWGGVKVRLFALVYQEDILI
ncbi:hypothetical protein [Paenibacillus sp. Soil724D2]|uniref:hypothetical protein n=1 Tax=Paenibacillus sp. (strain Soil724D2) TaxID=1736392 RepID=UPI0007131BF9|nr:hypothetical protein [Paenibacillus sp. Soil724D2]KRE48438.1 hypothetical protein ASG85_05395 [Paenibacillus sp. Soil724D2]